MNKGRRIITVLVLLLSVFPFCNTVHADEQDCPYKVIDGNIKIFDYMLEPVYPVTGEEFISCTGSPDGRWVAIQSGCRIEVDIWLYDSLRGGWPVRIDTEPGNHTRVVFHGNEVFEVRWGGMGYRMSDFFQVDDPGRKVHLDDVLKYYEDSDMYIAFDEQGIEIGTVFGPEKKERFDVDFEIENVPLALTPLDVIKNVEIVDGELIVHHKIADNVIVKEIFQPEMLKTEKH